MKDWASVPAEYREANPKLDFYGHDGMYLYSSNWYRNVRHAWAHVPGRPHVNGIVARIERAKENSHA